MILIPANGIVPTDTPYSRIGLKRCLKCCLNRPIRFLFGLRKFTSVGNGRLPCQRCDLWVMT